MTREMLRMNDLAQYFCNGLRLRCLAASPWWLGGNVICELFQLGIELGDILGLEVQYLLDTFQIEHSAERFNVIM